MTPLRLTQQLLNWYDRFGRTLPWRFKGGAHPNPYIVLVSEIMLQQTTVKTVIPYFERFIAHFPTIDSLANASEDEVLQYWQGLGYYTRARNLQASARIIVQDLNGRFPQTLKEVSRLKGLGAYTRASFLALAFNKPETVVDGNVMRIICRLKHWTAPLDEIKRQIEKEAQKLTSKTRPADYASAIMDLGATVCTPKKPQCLQCPWKEACLSKESSDLESIPQRRITAKKEMRANVYVILNDAGKVFVRKHTARGLLSGLYEFPWREELNIPDSHATGLSVTHIFTHIRLTLDVKTAHMNNVPVSDGVFIPRDSIKDYPFSTLMQKVWTIASNL